MAKNKNQVITEIAEKIGKPQAEVTSFFNALCEVLVDSVKSDGKLTIPGYFSMERIMRAARTGRNPQTGETIQIEAGYGVKISAGTKLKTAAAEKK